MKKNTKPKPLENHRNAWILSVAAGITSLILDRKAFDPFNTPKLICILLLSSWLMGHLLYSYRKEYIKYKSIDGTILIISMVFIISMMVATIFSESKILAITGDAFRRNGLLQYLSLTIILLISIRVFDFENTLKIYKVAIFISLIMSLYGLLQISGNDFYAWNNPYNSMISTVGNPNFAAALLAIFTLICFSALRITKFSFSIKIIAILTICLSLVAIYLSDSRQGLVTISIGLMFYITFSLYSKSQKLGVIASIIFTSIALLGILGMLQKGPFSNFLYKESVSVRGFYWRAGIDMFKEFPFTGVGLDNFGAYFKEFREVEYPLRYGFDITSSNAHNTVIQLFSTGGLFVGLSYLLLLIYVFITGLKLVIDSKTEEKNIALGLLTAWIAFQAQTLISIDNIGVSIWGWLLSGAILGLARNKEQVSVRGQENRLKKNQVRINVFQPLTSLLFLIPSIFISYQLLQADRDLLLARDYVNPAITQNKNTVNFFANQVIQNPLAINYYKLQAALFTYEMGDTSLAEQEIYFLYKKDPKNIDILKSLLAIETKKNNIAKVIDIRLKIAQEDPWNAQNYFELCKKYIEIGDFEKASSLKKKIVTFAPNSEYANEVNLLPGLN